eukprot:CAMPEP_0178983582 /NCGR_PEP_ID=MMETSP0795-20121207/1138_1 /TAXON_ID=88552 /ORGANISM="Amoebophrya sp., Strain Ameob2" /LENGTH=569 /DNA_ID=CAMNT_0020674367 /DNA_START=93 /DNA_END=1803 /DNA_ORIENTATION=-
MSITKGGAAAPSSKKGSTPKSQAAAGGDADGAAAAQSSSQGGNKRGSPRNNQAGGSSSSSARTFGFPTPPIDKAAALQSAATSADLFLGYAKHPLLLVLLVVVVVFYGPAQPLTAGERQQMIDAVIREQGGHFASQEDIQHVERTLHTQILAETEKIESTVNETVRGLERSVESQQTAVETVERSVDKVEETVSALQRELDELREKYEAAQNRSLEERAERKEVELSLLATVRNATVAMHAQARKTAAVTAAFDKFRREQQAMAKNIGGESGRSGEEAGRGEQEQEADHKSLYSTAATATLVTPDDEMLNWATKSLGSTIRDSSAPRNTRVWKKPLLWLGENLSLLSPENHARLTLTSPRSADELLAATPPVPGEAYATLLPGYVQISLGMALSRVTGIGIRHLSPALTPNPRSAPRHFSVTALFPSDVAASSSAARQNRSAAALFNRVSESMKSNVQNLLFGAPTRDADAASSGSSGSPPGSLLTQEGEHESSGAVEQSQSEAEKNKKYDFEFAQMLGLQVFEVDIEGPVRDLRFDFHSAWGGENQDYVTLFRIEVYGEVGEIKSLSV